MLISRVGLQTNRMSIIETFLSRQPTLFPAMCGMIGTLTIMFQTGYTTHLSVRFTQFRCLLKARKEYTTSALSVFNICVLFDRNKYLL